MEKLKTVWNLTKSILINSKNWFLGLFLSHPSQVTQKTEFNKENILKSFFVIFILFVAISLLAPTEDTRVFSEVAEQIETEHSIPKKVESATDQEKKKSAENLWGSGNSQNFNHHASSQVNYNTAMVIGSKNGNAKDQLHAGTKIRLQNVDKFIASSDGTPLIARSIEAVSTDGGFSIPEGAIFYGEASFNTASGKADIKFNRVSFPDGRIQDIQALAVDSSGQAGLDGNTKSDAIKNSAGQIITTFVAGLAAGSVSRDMFGASSGGVQNGLLQAVADTAKDRASSYGEKMKQAREWIEVESGVYFDALIQQSINLRPELNQGSSYE
jgi:Bacterial conjugation TrbI-like protein